MWAFQLDFGLLQKRSSVAVVMDRSEIPRDPDVNRDFSRSRSQVIRSCRVHLWCSPSAGCNQSSGRLDKEVAVPPAQLGVCFQGVDTISWLIFHLAPNLSWVCLGFLSFGQFLYISNSHFTFGFGSNVYFCSSIILIESMGGCGFYSHCHLLDTKGQVCFDPFVIGAWWDSGRKFLHF